jgi:ribosomal-protein-alanine N-acetyltransferase
MRRGDGATGGRGDGPTRPVSDSPRRPVEDSAVTVRDIRTDDFEELLSLDQRCFEPGISYSRAELRGFLRLPTLEGALAEIGGKLAGFVISYRAPGNVGHVITLDVAAGLRRSGVGRALLAEAMARLARRNVRRYRLEVDAANAPAIAFYESFGFRESRRLPDYYGNGRTGIEMTLDR